MKIALVGYEANIKNRVGSNQYAFELTRALWKDDKENEYLVFLPSSPLPDLPKEKENWHYKVAGPQKFWNFFGLPLGLIKEKPKPDVVFIPGHYAPIYSPSPVAVSVMDLGYLRFPHHFTKSTYLKLKFWTEFSLKKAALVFAISSATKDDIVNFYKINENKILVTYPGYNKEVFDYQKINPENIQKIKEKYRVERYILFLSTLKPSKNVEGLIDAYKILNFSDIKLVIAGKKGWMYKEIFKLVKEKNLENKVVFTDFVPEEEVPSLMKGAEVFVLPSFWEGFGIPVVEAMACGVPVVVSNAGSLPEIVGDAGIIIDPYKPETIAMGIENALQKKDILVKKGFQQIKKFDWNNCALKTIDGLQKLNKLKNQ